MPFDSDDNDIVKNEANNNNDDLLDNIDKLKTTETDMMFGYFANKDKMVNDSEVKQFQKPEDDYNDHKYSDSDRDHDKYRDTKDDHYDHKDTYDYNTPQPSKYGPSYGPSGDDDYKNNHSDNRNDDRNDYRNDGHHSDSESEEFKTKEDLMLGKLDMLRKLGELTQHGVKLSQNYNMNSDIQAMRYEYELHKSIRDKHNGVKWLNNMMLNTCYGIEIANEHFNPFDFHLDGWSEQMAHDSDEYYDVFGELYEKYFKSGKPIPPELKLFLMVGGSAMKFHMQHTMMSKIPNIGDMMNNNPAMVDKLRQQAVNDKINQQRGSTRESFNNSLSREHDLARQKAEDIEMLRQREQELYAQQQMQNQYGQNPYGQNPLSQSPVGKNPLDQQIYYKQNKLNELQNQLNHQMSDSTSNNTDYQKTMKEPVIPSSLMNNANSNDKTKEIEQEMLRQHYIMNHKKMLQQEELMKRQYGNNDTVSYDGSSVNINPELDKILGSKFRGDQYSKISEGSSLDGDDLASTEDSKVAVKRRGRRKKSNLKVNT
jgi:hypothetical protein